MHCTDEFDLYPGGRFYKVENLRLELGVVRTRLYTGSTWIGYEGIAISKEGSDAYGNRKQKSAHFARNKIYVAEDLCNGLSVLWRYFNLP